MHGQCVHQLEWFANSEAAALTQPQGGAPKQYSVPNAQGDQPHAAYDNGTRGRQRNRLYICEHHGVSSTHDTRDCTVLNGQQIRSVRDQTGPR